MRPFCTALNTEVDDTVSSWKLSLPRRAVRDYPSVGLTESKIWKTRRETRTTPSYSPIRTPNSSLAHELDTEDRSVSTQHQHEDRHSPAPDPDLTRDESIPPRSDGCERNNRGLRCKWLPGAAQKPTALCID